jgi:hypothetical protein
MPDVDELYGLPLEEFVSARGALAKALRAEGRQSDAKEVAALRKPSAPAWAVNQLVRTQKGEMRDLFAAGDALQDAQSNLLEGRGDPARLREATERERQCVEKLLERARGLLSDGGQELSPTALSRVSDTLHAAALDQEARSEIKPGRLERELRHVGLGSAGLSASTPAPSKTRKSAKRTPTGGKQQPRGKKSGKDHAKPEADRKAARRDAERAVKAAREAVKQTERKAESARKRHEGAVEALEAAEAADREARESARTAKQELRRAEQVQAHLPRLP